MKRRALPLLVAAACGTAAPPEPLSVGPGDVARLECTFDTRGRDAPVTWGEGTRDKMCLAGFYVAKR